ncbi:MAG: S1C family serine protease [Luteolibacter sp.]
MMKRSNYVLGNARVLVLAAALLISGKGVSQQSLETNFRMTGAGVLGAFEPQREVIQQVSAVILSGRSEVSYGVVLSEDGYILTKASEIAGIADLDVRVDRKSFKSAEVVMVDPRWDVALLKVDAKDLVPADFAEDSDLAQGTWVVVNGATSRTKRRILAGIISAKPREIEPEGGAVLGVSLKEKSMKVSEITPKSGAEEAGMKEGDLIEKVDGEAVGTIEELAEMLKEKKAGTRVPISVKRDGEILEMDVKLLARGELFQEITRNDQMSGNFSKRRSGFPQVVQHDILANSNTMGGPVLNLAGEVVGMNIARANRAETFAIPVEELKSLAEGMIEQSKKQ